MRHDPALTVNNEGFRHATHIVSLADLVLRIQQYLEVVTIFLDIGRDHHPALGILADRQHHEVLVVAELVVQGLHRGHFLAARPAPGRPDVEKNYLASQFVERHGASVESFELEVGGLTAGALSSREASCPAVREVWRLCPATSITIPANAISAAAR